MSETLYESNIEGLPLLFRGKVRDVYDAGDALLVVTSDRLSAFDVVLPTPIPDKGRVLNSLSLFWFERTRHLVANHLLDRRLEDVVPPAWVERLRDRAQIVRKAKPLPVEAVVRGYLVGSGWEEYRKQGTVCGEPLPSGLRQADRLPQVLFTPSTKAPQGEHDQNISFAAAEKLLGPSLAARVRELSIALYNFGAAHAEARGIIFADTKFEFGLIGDEVILIDEVMTPDSSRFWPQDEYRPGTSPPSFDKQFVRDYLTQIGWNKEPPAPPLPDEVVRKTSEKYREALKRLTS
jgi:phosphoribosylaminoimidazole-succinocarboxamide synthase